MLIAYINNRPSGGSWEKGPLSHLRLKRVERATSQRLPSWPFGGGLVAPRHSPQNLRKIRQDDRRIGGGLNFNGELCAVNDWTGRAENGTMRGRWMCCFTGRLLFDDPGSHWRRRMLKKVGKRVVFPLMLALVVSRRLRGRELFQGLWDRARRGRPGDDGTGRSSPGFPA